MPIPKKMAYEWYNEFIRNFANFKDFARKIREEKHQIYLSLPLKEKLEYLYNCNSWNYGQLRNTIKKTIDSAIISGEVTEEEAQKIHESIIKMQGWIKE